MYRNIYTRVFVQRLGGAEDGGQVVDMEGRERVDET